jgi:TonB family protein
MRQIGLALASVSMMLSNSADAEEPERLAPSSKWQVHYADNKCVLGRVFGKDKAAVSLVLEQVAPGDFFRVSIIGSRMGSWNEERTFEVRFGPDEVWQDAGYFRGNYGKDRPAVVVKDSLRLSPYPAELIERSKRGELVTPEPITTAQKAAVRSLDIKYRGREINLATGPLDKVFSAMNTCLDALVEKWGFDPKVMATLQRWPMPIDSKRPLLTSADYPFGAVVSGQRGIVIARLNIDPAGNVVACEVQHSSKGDEFGQTVCNALSRRAKFSPAINASGNPVAAYRLQQVTFQFP